MSVVPLVSGKLVAITGDFEMGRQAAVQGLEALGATIAKRISNKTDLLFRGANPGMMLDRARFRDVPVFDEAVLVAVIEGGASGQATAVAPAREPRKDARTLALEEIEARVAPLRDAEIEAFGHSIGELFQVWVKLFAKRKDVRIQARKFAKGASPGALRKVRWLPDHVLALYASVGEGELAWSFEEQPAGMQAGFGGGRIKLRGVKRLAFRSRPMDWDFATYVQDAPFDELETYGSGRMSYEPGETTRDAKIVFHDVDSADRIPYETAQNYLKMGAERAFVWTWQLGDGGEAKALLDRLLEASVPPSASPAELAAMLAKRGASPSQAEGLVKWLGDRVVALLPR